MAFINYRKETSERSDASNWAKQILIEQTGLYFDSIEGCNENSQNLVTHMMERARVDYTDETPSDVNSVLENIKTLETSDVLLRKINFATTFQRPLTYVLYCDEKEFVWMYTINSLGQCTLDRSFDSYQAFSNWIASVKGWKSTKPYRERQDLPYFDKALRKAGTAWPTNIDCFVSNKEFQPIGIIEFQNAKQTEVKRHNNNEFFHGKYARQDQWGHVRYDNDVRRWQSQEILRLQSGLRLFVITWAQNSNDYQLKEISVITFSNLPNAKNWAMTNEYQRLMHELANNHSKETVSKIAGQFSSYNLIYQEHDMDIVTHQPPLSVHEKTFPFIYYRYKNIVEGKRETLPNDFLELLSRI